MCCSLADTKECFHQWKSCEYIIFAKLFAKHSQYRTILEILCEVFGVVQGNLTNKILTIDSNKGQLFKILGRVQKATDKYKHIVSQPSSS